jgi:hypothetical protein
MRVRLVNDELNPVRKAIKLKLLDLFVKLKNDINSKSFHIPCESFFLKRFYMKTNIILILCIVFVAVNGCDKPSYNGICDITKKDGKVTSMVVTLPRSGQTDVTRIVINNREDADKLVEGLESLALDVKMARDQMAVEEPKLEKK